MLSAECDADLRKIKAEALALGITDLEAARTTFLAHYTLQQQSQSNLTTEVRLH